MARQAPGCSIDELFASPMIDLHCHFLPGVDDGPEQLDVAIRLAEAAVANGISVSALTPHVHPRRYPNTRSSLQQTFSAFQQELVKRNIPLRLFLGGEVRFSPESLDLIMENDVPYYAEGDGYKIMLLEFPHDMIPAGSQQFVAKLLSMKIRPLIAHPERNKTVMNDVDRIRPFVDMGCWLQVTAGSLAGSFGKPAKQVALQLLEDELIWVVATDAHTLGTRPPDLAEGRDVVADIMGARLARRMVLERPARILGLDLAALPA